MAHLVDVSARSSGSVPADRSGSRLGFCLTCRTRLRIFVSQIVHQQSGRAWRIAPGCLRWIRRHCLVFVRGLCFSSSSGTEVSKKSVGGIDFSVNGRRALGLREYCYGLLSPSYHFGSDRIDHFSELSYGFGQFI